MGKVHMLSYQRLMVAGHIFKPDDIDEAYDYCRGLSQYGTTITLKHLRGFIVEGKKEIKWLNRGSAEFKYGVMTDGKGTLNVLPRVRRKSITGCVKS